MKKILFLSTTLALFFAAIACSEKEEKVEVEDAVTLSSAASVNVPVEGDVVSISFNASVAWTAASDADWVSLTPASGDAGDAGVKAAVTKNAANDSRTATVTITAGTASAKVTITQDQTNALNIKTLEYNVAVEGGTVEIEVEANVDYTVSIPEAITWITDATTKGMTTSKITLNVAATTETEERSAKVTISAGDLSSVVTITQAAFEPFFDFLGDYSSYQFGFYDGNPLVFTPEATEIRIEVNTNLEWMAYFAYWDESVGDAVATQEGQWMTITQEENAIVLKVNENTEYFKRTDYMYVACFLGDNPIDSCGALVQIEQKGLEAPVTPVLQWNATVPADITLGYNRLAFWYDHLIISDEGERIHMVDPASGSYVQKVDLTGIVINSIDTDDAGNTILATDLVADIDWGTGELTSGTSFNLYYIPAGTTNVYAIQGIENKDYGTIGGFRVRGDISKKGVITGVAGSASCWLGYDVAEYAVVSNYYGTQNQGPGPGSNTFWTPSTAASVSYASETLGEGVLFRGYDGAESLYYLADAYTPNWAVAYDWKLISTAGSGGNENQNNLDIIEYKGHRVAAFTQGFHFAYSSNADIFILDITDINNVTTIATIPGSDYILDNEWSGSNSADVMMRAEDNGIGLYVIHSGKATLAKFIFNVE